MPNTNHLHSQTILVSAFISNINQRIDRNIDKYIEHGILLLRIPLPKIVFIEKDVYYKYNLGEKKDYDKILCDYECIYHPSIQTLFVFFEKHNMYFYREHLDASMTLFHLNTSNPLKDTPEYMFIQNYKTEWMRLAIHIIESQVHIQSKIGIDKFIEYPPNNQYIWMDFGISHMFQNNETLFQTKFSQMVCRIEDRFKVACENGFQFNSVYFASCWNHQLHYVLDIYSNIYWVFAGSVFGGYRDALLEFADLVKQECIHTIQNKNTLMWEVNIWYLVYQKHAQLFSFYPANHDPSIIDNY